LIRRPPRLPARPTVGIVSPASPVSLALLQSGIDVLSAHGFGVRLAPHALDSLGHMAGTDQARADDLAAFYTDPEIDIVWCARGGSSSCRLWPWLGWDTLAALPPKLVVGYSDITSLHVALVQRAHTVALHGPMVCELAQTPPGVLDWLFALLRAEAPSCLVPGQALHVLTAGVAEGTLVGGCLSLLCATLGTPYQLDTRGSLLLLEDIDEAPHQVERYLVQMREAGLLASAAGFVIGEATRADDAQTRPMAQIWADFLALAGKPAVRGFPFGHVAENYALPLGTRARLDADARTLTLLEPLFQE